MSTATFLSYSHDSGPHVERVLALADQLRTDGVDAHVDQHVREHVDDWSQWSEHQVQRCRFVVVVVTPTYRSRYDRVEPDTMTEPDRRAGWETTAVRNLLYAAGGRNPKVIPVVFEPAHEPLVPLSLRGSTCYQLPDDYEGLLRRLLDRPRTPPPTLGVPPKLDPAPRPDFFALMKSEPPTGLRGASVEAPSERAEPEPARAQVPRAETSAPAAPQTLTLPGAPDHRVTLIVFTANGVEPRPRLRLGKELRAITKALQDAELGDRCRLVVSPMATFADVVRELDEHRPALVHFSGHTEHDSGYLVLESEDEGQEVYVSPQQLADLLALIRPAPILVTLCACLSTGLAEAAARHARYAIGFGDVVVDGWVPRFSATLYERLLAHAPLDVPRALRMTQLAWQSEVDDVAGAARLYRGTGASDDAPGGGGSASPRSEAWSRPSSGPASPVDVLVVTALGEELDALLAVDEGIEAPWTRERADPPRHTAVFEGEHGLFRVVAVRLTGMGGALTAATVAPLLDALGPRSLAMCGVCAGHPHRTEYGDVVIADRVFQYDEGKVKKEGFEGDLWVSAMTERWLRAAQELSGAAEGVGTTVVDRQLYHVHVGPMGSGNAVVADGKIWDRVARGGMRKTLAVDMEAATIGRLARARSLPFAVVKGVMDHGDAQKSDRFKAFAARAAADVLLRLLRRVVEPRA